MLDVIEMGVAEHVPDGPQSENWRVSSRTWTRVGRLSWDDLATICDERPLWMHGTRKSDRVTEAEAILLEDSIRLISVNKVRVYTTTGFRGTPQHRATFSHSGSHFDLVVTDLWYDEYLRSRGLVGESVEFDHCYLTISLSHPYDDGTCYKLVAAIVTEERSKQGLL